MGLAKSKPKAATPHPPLEDTTRTPSGHVLPNPVHLRLSIKQLPPGRLIVVGDIHGCYQELLALLEACGYQPGADALFLLGDLVNKGPSSPQVGATRLPNRGWHTVRLQPCTPPHPTLQSLFPDR